MPVSALWVFPDSHYSRLGCDVWDIRRDARKYDGLNPVIAHPPCGHWGRYSHVCRDDGSDAFYAISAVQRCGGVLEQPAYSRMFLQFDLPLPGCLPDLFGGYTVRINQFDFGHKALKPTWLYIVRREFVLKPFRMYESPVELEVLSKKERSLTPYHLASELVRMVASHAAF